mmetsp:Transcript_36499/g.74163  ORF Transcript_36499/g.74163 Transcript_36499/m.74163 type:complete len:266 (-) Transcript_36499:511-1308(-)
MTIFDTLGDSDGPGGVINFELFNRFIGNRVKDSSSSSCSLLRSPSGAESNVVGLDPHDVEDTARVALVQLKELRSLAASEDGPCPDPDVKLCLRCPKVEPKHGRQPKETAALGSAAHVVWDPPEFEGFVVDAVDLSKAKVYVTVMDKNVLTKDSVIGTAVLPLKAFDRSDVLDLEPAASASSAAASSGAAGAAVPRLEVVQVLSNPKTGESTKVTIVLGLQLMSKEAGFGFGVEKVFELQRWRLECDPVWGSGSEHFLPADPGKR